MCEINLPQKRNYRQRAHSNPIADHIFNYPLTPDEFYWPELLPTFKNGTDKVTIIDVGCGYGGLCITLAEMFPDQFIVGLEIRVKVSEFTKNRILALRSKHVPLFQNVCCIRTNAMKYLPNYFHKHQIEKMFFLYPDPHFKTNKHKWRIISDNLLTEYAYILAPKAVVYTLTDVEDLHNWIVDHFTKHPLFHRIDENGLMNDDPIVKKILVEDCSEEGKKVSRNQGNKFLAVFKRT